jgi:hypothetical protein
MKENVTIQEYSIVFFKETHHVYIPLYYGLNNNKTYLYGYGLI